MTFSIHGIIVLVFVQCSYWIYMIAWYNDMHDVHVSDTVGIREKYRYIQTIDISSSIESI